MPKFLRRDDVEEITGLRRSTLYLKMKRGEFPKPVPLGTRGVAWVESEIREWQDACIANRVSGSKN